MLQFLYRFLKKSITFTIRALIINIIITNIANASYQDAYILGETNPVATAICKGIAFAQTALMPIAAITLAVAGFAAFQGKLSPTMLITFAIGIAIVRNPGTILEIISPQTGLQFACKCMTQKTVIRESRGSDGTMTWQKINISTGVDENCNPL